jgi:hypothetical protein
MTWDDVAKKIAEECTVFLTNFLLSHTDEQFSFFAIGVDTEAFGQFSLYLDTLNNSIIESKKEYDALVNTRRKILNHKASWEEAHSYLEKTPASLHSSATWNFRFTNFATFSTNGYPANSNQRSQFSDDTFVLGNTKISIWKALDILSERNFFNNYNIIQYFRMGYQIYDPDNDYPIITTHIINW